MSSDVSPATTEQRLEANHDLDLWSTARLVELINDEDAKVAPAVRGAAVELALAIDDIAARVATGGRLVYVGAGTSGRLAVLDAAEVPPTFGVGTDRVVAVIAGGAAATAIAQEAAEAGDAGALTVAVTCVGATPLGRLTRHEVVAEVGPEVIAGSTRMKAGTAQKLVLNTISTVTMIRLGRTFGNLMVDVVASNAKLRKRSRRTVVLATGATDERAGAALEQADGDAKVAIVALLGGVDSAAARQRLERAGGAVRHALDDA